MKRRAVGAALVFCIGGLAFGQAVQHVARIGPAGAWAEAQVSLSAGARAAAPAGAGRDAPGIIWHLDAGASITEGVALSDTTDETWLGQALNFERLSYLQTTGNGTPIWEYDLLSQNPEYIGVRCAGTTSLGVAFVRSSDGYAKLQAFSKQGGSVPLWTYTFESPYTSNSPFAVDVAKDGQTVLVAAWPPAGGESLLVLLDGATGAELKRRVVAATIGALEFSDDAQRAVLTEGDTAEVIETAGLTRLFMFSVIGAGGRHRISADGKTVGAGGFDFKFYRETGGNWNLVYTSSENGEWLGNGIALTANGDTAIVSSYNYLLSNLQLTHRIIDLVAGTEIARTTSVGSGAYQDNVVGAEVSAKGDIFAVGTWGTQDNVHPEVLIFDRQLKLIGSIDTPGSAFAIDMSRDGRYVVAGGKRVHANSFGNGGDGYAYRTSVAAPGDLNCDGKVDFFDINPFVLALSDPAGYAAQYPNCDINNGDINGDGKVDFYDINPFVALLTNP